MLATLLAGSSDRTVRAAVRSAVPDWLDAAVRPMPRVGLHGGMAGTLFGLELLAAMHPPVSRLSQRVSGWLWERRFEEFDLVSGAVGACLAGYPQPVWFAGEDTGLAHGAAGVLLVSPQPDLISRLLEQSFVDQRRQGWCYGIPGIAWALWTAGARADAVRLVRILCQTFDPEVNLYGRDADRLGICHGAAGVLLIADAFARCGVTGAAGLRDLMRAYLLERLDLLPSLDETLLTGASGVLAALLTVDGANPHWLRSLGLH
ncbi:lanthionine synthetase LanC family protein [Kutzneria sp. 744]|uniref:lanthionine synthetase LanC family protein n=1 Tax=Kutzneria sp. (strain 744) TaxID=345341 RepID=UPI0003EEDFD3|nr:lanthionine synthetase LanC family protein [Kutzneria sp. 744]EWM12828.1 LigA protein [Kutzneria sp. 744]